LRILSHRGYWKNAEEKNTELAFKRSFALGYGTETDIRDYKGELVISHDMPDGTEIHCDAFLALVAEEFTLQGVPLTLALNIKADGLAPALKKLLDRQPPGLDSFAFDMSVPDMRNYIEAGVPVFARMSEVEKQPVWLELAAGVWLDSFYGEWYDNSVIESLLANGKRVCLVSPELHKRSRTSLWERIKPLAKEKALMLCTDFPEDATRFFFGCE
jgi:glycerophosphoryl diester phosphodiesterase